MANPLKILTVLTASKAAKFVEGLDVNSQKITNVADATVSTDAVAYGQLTSVSGAIKTYVDAQDTALSGAVKSYVDAQDTALSGAFDTRLIALSGAASSSLAAEKFAREAGDTQLTSLVNSVSQSIVSDYIARDSALSSSLKSYVDAANSAQDSASTAFSGAIKSYVDAADTALSGAVKTYVDAQDAALSGALKSYVDAADGVLDARITSVSGAIKTYVDTANNAQDAAAAAVSGALKAAIDAEASARAAEDLTFLKLDGSRSMSGSLNMGNQDITNAKSGSFSGDVTVAGNLQVNGALTYVNTTNLDVTDKLVTLAKGAVNAAAADGGGIELEGASASLTYASTGDKWVANKSFEVAADLFISGATDFSYINVSRTSGKYDVDAAIQALDVAVSGAVSAGGADLANVKASYDALRQVVTGTLSSGTALLTLAGTQFAAGEIDNLALDVMIDADSTGYTNDLVAIKMFVDGAAVKVQIDAPAAASAKYRLIVVNEKDGGLDVI